MEAVGGNRPERGRLSHVGAQQLCEFRPQPVEVGIARGIAERENRERNCRRGLTRLRRRAVGEPAADYQPYNQQQRQRGSDAETRKTEHGATSYRLEQGGGESPPSHALRLEDVCYLT